MINLKELEDNASTAEKNHKWNEASELFLALAYHWKDHKEFDLASDCFMRAAITAERSEDWRRIGNVWVECGSALQKRPHGPVTDVYDTLESSAHFFPTLDKFAWHRFSHEEKVGRAYRNAAYHLEKAGANQSAYTQYNKSGESFEYGGMPAEASRSYYHGLLSFIEAHGELDPGMLNSLERVNSKLITTDRYKYLKRMQLYYRGLSGRLTTQGNYSDSARLFCKQSEVCRALALRDRQIPTWIVYSAWKYSSNYGQSFWLWSLWAVILFLIVFPILLKLPGALTWLDTQRSANFFDYLFFSVMSVTTAPDPSFSLSLFGKILIFAETIVGFLMLGSLLVLLGKKMIR